MNATNLQLDYFQIYDFVKGFPVQRTPVELRDQFDKEPVKVSLATLIRFADRVSKEKEELFDKNAHLTWYRLRETSPAVIRRGRVTNQFFPKGQDLTIDVFGALLVPAQKRIPPQKEFSDKPKLDHYKVYRVIKGNPVDHAPVQLVDQFGERRTAVFEPRYFAVPVYKKYNNREVPIINEKAHLTIYRVDPLFLKEIAIDIRDQFFPRGLKDIHLRMSYHIAVPSEKGPGWEEG